MELFSHLTNLSLPKVSVCVCTYRRPNSLTRLLDSLAKQKHTDFDDLEVSIVNDGSHELSFYPSAYTRYPMKVIYTPAARHLRDLPQVYASKNIAVAQSHNEILWLLDDDIFVDDHTLFIIRLYHMRLAKEGLVLRSHEANYEDPTPYQAPWAFASQDWEMDKARVWFSFAGASLHREIWNDVGGLDETFDLAMGFADLDWGIRAWQKGYNITQADGFAVFIDDRETFHLGSGSHREKFLHLDGVQHRNKQMLREKWGQEEMEKWGLND